MPHATVLVGNAATLLRTLPPESAHCCVTSPPYWGLRDYGHSEQIGREPTPQQYVASLVEVFQEVRRVLRKDGTLWIIIGDSYAAGKPKEKSFSDLGFNNNQSRIPPPGLKPKDLCGIPWRVAFALQDDGWYLRQDIIWHKPNPIPESVTDRCTRAHEYLFMFSKSPRYHYDSSAIREPMAESSVVRLSQNVEAQNGSLRIEVKTNGATKAVRRTDKQRGHSRRHAGFNDRWDLMTVAEQRACGANKRSVWTIATANFKESHFATFPPDLIKPCILASAPPGATVLDPFLGSGTTASVALELARNCIGIELNPDYAALSESRIATASPGLSL